MKLNELSEKEKREINGGDEPAYWIGYYLGKAFSIIKHCFSADHHGAAGVTRFGE